MKLTFLLVGKRQELSELFKNPSYGYDMTIPIIFGVNQDVIQVQNNKDVKLLCKDLADVSLEACWYIC